MRNPLMLFLLAAIVVVVVLARRAAPKLPVLVYQDQPLPRDNGRPVPSTSVLLGPPAPAAFDLRSTGYLGPFQTLRVR